MTSRWKIGLVAAAVAGIATVGALAAAGGDRERADATVPDDSVPAEDAAAGRSITVSGHGTVDVVPDIATLTMGVQALKPTAQEAMDTIGTESQTLVDTLKGAGIAEEDIQTSGLNLYPNYGNDGSTINGYNASTNVTVTIRDVEQAGGIIDAVEAFVGEELTLGGISFSYADPEAVLGEARAEAIDNARTRAAQYAEAAGVEVGEIRQIVESSAGGPIPFPVARDAAAAEGALAIEPGTQELSVDVSVVFAMD
jgi:uncharacterized protein YggE